MRKEIRFGTSENFNFNNTTIRNAYLEIIVESTAVNTAVTTGIDLTQIQMILKANQEGSEGFTAMHLLPLAIAHSMRTPLLGNIIGASSKGEIIQVHTAALTQKRYLRVPLLLKPYILKGKDYVDLTLSVPSKTAICGADCQNTTITLVVEDGIAQQDNMVQYDLWNITTDRTTFSQTLGDDVTGIWLICLDKNYEIQNSPWGQISLGSNAFQEVKPIAQIIGDEMRSYPTADRLTKGQNYLIYQGVPIDNVVMQMNLVQANITANKCFILVERSSFDADVAARQIVRNAKRNQKLNVKVQGGLKRVMKIA